MHCPRCGTTDTRVTDSRDTGQEIRRRRACRECGARFTTYERLQHTVLQVIKRDGRRNDFEKEKLLRSLTLACAKRPIPTGALEKLADDIESDLRDLGKSEIPTSIIGDTTLARLRQLDSVAYVRYASVYRDFDTLEGFIGEIREYQTADAASAASSQLELIPNDYTIPPKRAGRRGRRPGMTLPAPIDAHDSDE